MPKAKVILFSLTAVLLFISMIQRQFHIFGFKDLGGVVEEVQMPKPTFGSYCDGSFQLQAEQHLKQQFGCREPLIRLYNQYLWDFYGKTNVGDWQVAFGKDGWLYEPWFVEDYYQGRNHSLGLDSLETAQKLEDEAFRIYQLQHVLEPFGTHLFVCLLPGKDLVYPEHLPDNNRYFKEKNITARDYFGPKFKEMGINHVNVEQWFLQMKDTASFALFPKTGTHWSNIASLYVADSVIRYMENLGDMNIRNIRIGTPQKKRTKYPDNDLEGLMNLMRPLGKNNNLYAKVGLDQDTAAYKPKTIVIGDSFYWNIANQLPLDSIFSSIPFWYYNSSVYYDTIHSSVKELDLLKEILSSDFVILSYCSEQQYDLGNGFTMDALVNICYDSADIRQKRNGIRRAIEMEDSWLGYLAEKAADKGITLDEAIDGETSWVLEHDWRKFYPELRDSIPLKRSSDFLRALEGNMFVETEKRKIEAGWRKTEKIMEMLQKKADERHISLDSMMEIDLRWIMNEKIRNGELSFKAGNTSVSSDQGDL